MSIASRSTIATLSIAALLTLPHSGVAQPVPPPQTAPSSAAASSTQPTSADADLALSLRDAIHASYRLAVRTADPSYAPNETLDDLTSRRDDACNALAKLLPPSFGRAGTLKLFAPGERGKPVAGWDAVHRLFSNPEHWLCDARTENVFAIDTVDLAVQVRFGEIQDKFHREVQIAPRTYSFTVYRLGEGATGGITSYLAKTPPAAEMIDPRTVIERADRADEMVTLFRNNQIQLQNMDLSAREAAIRQKLPTNYALAMVSLYQLLCVRFAQSLGMQDLRREIEDASITEAVTGFDTLHDADLIYCAQHSGTTALERLLAINQRMNLLNLAYEHHPLAGLLALFQPILQRSRTQPLPMAAPLANRLLGQLGRKLLTIPNVAQASQSAGAATLERYGNIEALIQSWHATPDQLNQAARDELNDMYSEILITLLSAGASNAMPMDNARVDQIAASLRKLCHDDQYVLVGIGTLYAIQHRDALAEQSLNQVIQTNGDPEEQTVALEWLAELRVRASDLPSALDDLQLATQLSPKNTDALLQYATTLDRAHEKQKAIDAYHKLLTLEPSTWTRAASVQKRIEQLEAEPASQPVSPGL